MPSIPTPSPRDAAIDAILRVLQSLDDNSPSLLRSAVWPDAVLDQSGLSALVGFPMPTLHGVDMIEKALLEHGVGAKMDTGHVASNFRVEVKGQREVVVGCMVIGSHYRLGEGLLSEKRGLMAGTRWKAVIVKDKDGEKEEEEWRIKSGELKALWAEGDLSLFKE